MSPTFHIKRVDLFTWKLSKSYYVALQRAAPSGAQRIRLYQYARLGLPVDTRPWLRSFASAGPRQPLPRWPGVEIENPLYDIIIIKIFPTLVYRLELKNKELIKYIRQRKILNRLVVETEF